MLKRRPLYVIGGGGLAREMAQLAEQAGGAWEFAGFIGEPHHVGEDLGFGQVVGDDAWLLDSDLEADLVMGVGSPAIRGRIVERYRPFFHRFQFPNLIHPSANVDLRRVSLGKGNAITAGCVFTCDIRVADFTLFNLQTTVGHDASIGSCCVVNPSVNISGAVTIGDRVLIGTGAQLLEGRRVHDDAVVGAGAVVRADVEAGVTVVGVPARPLIRE
jgi:sugar O-acyltransferase (sialic acid O-acetyltransferase NeuD family)